ncbi:potassium transporter TrkG [Oscillospiraceae bacterium MB08-C2-2]|nr:potassium transporter TrkG [Oscillospiraceae bacterium MB08-C2-2]
MAMPVWLKKFQQALSPAQIIALSFLFVILLGGFLLSLPISHQENVDVPVLDAFFTAVSAVCVTGLVTVTTASTWSLFGKLVILFLIQIGGLSLITLLTYFMVNFGKKVSLKDRLMIQTAFNHSSLGGMVKMVLLVIKGTLVCEALGAAILFFSFAHQGVAWHKALFYGIFHAISAFCNAGFDIIGDQSLIPYSANLPINVVIMALIIIGGIGFTVWKDFVSKIMYFFSAHIKQRYHFSLHTKLALITTIALIVGGMLFFLIAEYNNPQTIGGFSLPHKLLAALFQSVTLRTAGFATIAQNGLTEASKLISSLLMLVGGSPGGTAGGMKTVTLAIIVCSVWSIIKGRKNIVVLKRTISVITLQKSLTVIVLMLLLLFIGTAILSATEDHTVFPHGISDLLFEVSSALGTVGLTTGITPYLSSIGKNVLMLCMFIGRIGPITLIISLSHKVHNGDDLLGYPAEEVMIG